MITKICRSSGRFFLFVAAVITLPWCLCLPTSAALPSDMSIPASWKLTLQYDVRLLQTSWRVRSYAVTEGSSTYTRVPVFTRLPDISRPDLEQSIRLPDDEEKLKTLTQFWLFSLPEAVRNYVYTDWYGFPIYKQQEWQILRDDASAMLECWNPNSAGAKARNFVGTLDQALFAAANIMRELAPFDKAADPLSVINSTISVTESGIDFANDMDVAFNRHMGKNVTERLDAYMAVMATLAYTEADDRQVIRNALGGDAYDQALLSFFSDVYGITSDVISFNQNYVLLNECVHKALIGRHFNRLKTQVGWNLLSTAIGYGMGQAEDSITIHESAVYEAMWVQYLHTIALLSICREGAAASEVVAQSTDPNEVLCAIARQRLLNDLFRRVHQENLIWLYYWDNVAYDCFFLFSWGIKDAMLSTLAEQRDAMAVVAERYAQFSETAELTKEYIEARWPVIYPGQLSENASVVLPDSSQIPSFTTVCLSPAGGVNFGDVFRPAVVSRVASFCLGNDPRGYGWTASVVGAGLSLASSSGSASQNASSTFDVLCNTLAIAPGGNIAGTVTLNVAPIGGTATNIQVSVTGRVIDPASLLEQELPVQFDGRDIVDDGWYVYAGGWHGSDNQIAIFQTNALSMGVLRFDLSVVPADYYITDARLELTVDECRHPSTHSIYVYEHVRAFTDGSCFKPTPHTSIETSLGKIAVSKTGVVSLGGTRLEDTVRKWAANPAQNYGLVLEPEAWFNAIFISSERTGTSGPRLFLTCQVPDTQKPQVVILSPRNGAVVAGDICSVSGRASDRHGIASVTVGRQNATIVRGSSPSAEVSFERQVSIVPGTNVIEVAVTDGAEEENTKVRTVHVYRPAFALRASAPSVYLAQGGMTNLTLTIDADQGFVSMVQVAATIAGVVVTLDSSTLSGGQSAVCSLQAGTLLPRGAYDLLIKGVGGGVTRTSTVTVVVRDAMPPLLSVAEPADTNLTTLSSNVLLRGTAQDVGSAGLAGVSVIGTAGQQATASNLTNGNWSFMLPVEPGYNRFTIIAEDHDGNQTRCRVLVTRPEPPTGSPQCLQPVDGATGQAVVGLHLNWSGISGAESYILEWSPLIGALGGGLTNTASNVTSRVVTGTGAILPPLAAGQTYYWRVSACNSYGTNCSAISSFTPIGPNTVAAWRFDESGGSVIYDVSGKNRPLQLNGATLASSGALLGNSLMIASNGQFAVSTNIPFIGGETVGLWFRGGAATNDPAAWAQVAAVGPYTLDVSGGRTLRLKNGSKSCEVAGVSTDAWCFASMKFDYAARTAELKLFNNNLWQTSSVLFTAFMPSVGSNIWLGATNGVTSFRGLIDEVVILEAGASTNDVNTLVDRIRQNARFAYSLSVMTKWGAPILNAAVRLDDAYGVEAASGAASIAGMPPGLVVCSVAVPNYVFTNSVLNLPWKDAALIVRPADDRPFGNVVSGPGTVPVGKSNQFVCSAFDFESGRSTFFVSPRRVRMGTGGSIYIVDETHSTVYRTQDGSNLVVYAGTGNRSFSGDGGWATNADLAGPVDIAFDTTGNGYIADKGNNRVRKVSTNGVITTYVGNGGTARSTTPVGGNAATNAISEPSALCWSGGMLFLGDRARDALLQVNASQVMSVHTTVGEIEYYPNHYLAHGGNFVGVLHDGASIWAANGWDYFLRLMGGTSYNVFGGGYRMRFNGDGVATNLVGFDEIADVALGAVSQTNGLKLVCDAGAQRVRYLMNGNWYTLAGGGGTGYPLEGYPAYGALFRRPVSVCSTGLTNYIADEQNYAVYRTGTNGLIYPFFESGCIPQGTSLWYQIDFGDGVVSDWSTLRTASHSFASEGSYLIRTRVRDRAGNETEWSGDYTITASQAPTNEVIYTNMIVRLGQVASNQIIRARNSTILATNSDFIVRSGASITLDGSSLVGKDGGRISLEGAATLMAFNESTITADWLTANKDTNVTWWADSDNSVFEMTGGRLIVRNMDMDVSRFILRNVRGYAFAYPGSSSGQPGSNMLLRVRSSGELSMIDGGGWDIIGGAGAPGSTGGNGAIVDIEFSSRGVVLLSHLYSDFYVLGGAGAESTGTGRSGSGGPVSVLINGVNGVSVVDSDLDIESGYAPSGSSGSGAGGSGGAVSLQLNSDGRLLIADSGIDVTGSDGGDGSYNGSGTAGDAGAGGPCSVLLRAGSLIASSNSVLDFAAGAGGDGGEGENPGDAGAGGDFSLSCMTTGAVDWHSGSLYTESGDGGAGGDGIADSGTAGATGGRMDCVFTTGVWRASGFRMQLTAGDGGDAGRPDASRGEVGGVAGCATVTIVAASVEWRGCTLEVEAGTAGSSESGDDTSTDAGSPGVAGGAAFCSMIVSSNLLIAGGSSIDVRGMDGGDAGDGDSPAYTGGRGGDGIMIVNSRSLIGIYDSSIEVMAGDGGDGNYTEGTGGNGGVAGVAQLSISSTGACSLAHAGPSKRILYVKSGDGGDAGRGASYSGIPVVGGQALLNIVSTNTCVTSGAVLALGGIGGDGNRGTTGNASREKAGAQGGTGIVTIAGGPFAMTDADLCAKGGKGGSARLLSGGASGVGLLTVLSSRIDAEDSALLGVSGMPGQNTAGAFGSHVDSTLSLDTSGEVRLSVLGQKVSCAANVNLVGVRMAAFRNFNTSRAESFKLNSLDLSAFLKPQWAAPYDAETSWTFTYTTQTWDWAVSSSILGGQLRNAQFGSSYYSDLLPMTASMLSRDYLTWSNANTVSFSDGQPNVTTTNDAVVELCQIYQFDVIDSAGVPFVGRLDVTMYGSGITNSTYTLEAPPYFLTFPGWRVHGSTYDAISAGVVYFGLKTMGQCVNRTNLVFGGNLPTFRLSTDTDNDGISTDEEVRRSLNPQAADTDGDGLDDLFETLYGLSPLNRDSDNDGVDDATELRDGTDPLSPSSYGDRQPRVSLIAVSPAVRSAACDLTAHVIADDPDGQPVSIEYVWNVIGDSRTVQTASNTLSRTFLRRGDTWVLSVRASSGFPLRYSAWTKSYSIAVLNSAPVVDLPDVVSVGAQRQTSFGVAAIDPDGDALTWMASSLYGNTSLSNGVLKYRPPQAYATGDVVQVAVSDGWVTNCYQIRIAIEDGDDDGDGLVNMMELYFLNADPANNDSDGDGMRDGDEDIAGTILTDASSVFDVWIAQTNRPAFAVEWLSVTGRTYDVLSSALTNSSFEWVELTNGIRGTGTAMKYDDARSPAGSVYRLKVRRQ